MGQSNSILMRRLCRGAPAVAACLGVHAAFAQDTQPQDSSVGLTEVVVTAQRFEQTLQEVPVALTVLTAEDLELRNVVGVGNLQASAPNVRLVASSGGSFSSAHIFVRGVGQRDYDITQEAQVPVYVDGVYLARTTGSMVNFMDVERVEVLRGPQGTLFGRNAVGGAVQIVSARPTDEHSATVRLSAGSFERRDIEGMVNIPLSDTLLARLSGASQNRDGYARLLPTGTQASDQTNNSVRGQLLWKGSGIDALLRFDAHSRRANMGLQNLYAINNPSAPSLVALNAQLAQQGLPLIDSNLIQQDPYDGLSYMTAPDATDIWGTSLEVSAQLGQAELKSITAYRTMDQKFGFDYDGTQYSMSEGITANDQWQLSQELQLLGTAFSDRVKWMVGLFYFKESVQQAQSLVATPPAVIRTGPGPFDFINNSATGTPLSYRADQTTQSYAAYSQVGIELTSKLTATVGVRVTRDEKDYLSMVGSRAPANIRAPGTVSNEWTDYSPKFGLDYRLTDDLMVYVSMAKGFQSGGFNGRVYAPRSPESFDPQELWSYQSGVKSEWLDKRLRLNADVYLYDYQNYQGLSFIPGTQNLVVSNIASVQMYGAEVDLLARLTPAFELSASVGYLHQKIDEILPGGSVSIQPNYKLPESPELTGQLGAQYRVGLGGWGDLILRGDYAYTGATQFRLGIVPTEHQGGYGLAGARVSFVPQSEAWELSFSGTNLSDKRYRTYAQYSSAVGLTAATWAPPAEWGVSIRAKF